jgi:hypothetical protein
MSYLYNRPSSGIYGDPDLEALAREGASPQRPISLLGALGVGGAAPRPELANSDQAFDESVKGIPVQVASADGPKGDAAMDTARTLARMIFSEAAESYQEPNVYEGVGWAALNRLGAPGFAQRFGDLFSRGQFNAVGNPLWRRAANPSSLQGDNAAAYNRALTVANGILDGRIADPTGEAQFFYSGDAPSDYFSRAIDSGRLERIEPRIGPFTFLRDTQQPRRRR